MMEKKAAGVMPGPPVAQPSMSRQVAQFLLSTANFLTLLRLLATPLVVLLVWRSAEAPEWRSAGVALLVFLQATDMIDGFLARAGRRRLGAGNRFGEILDPLADKLYIGAAYLTLALTGQFHLWFACLVILRDVSIVLGWSLIFYRAGVAIQPNIAGKIADGFQAFFLAGILLQLSPSVIVFGTIATAATIVFSGISYAMTARHSVRHCRP